MCNFGGGEIVRPTSLPRIKCLNQYANGLMLSVEYHSSLDSQENDESLNKFWGTNWGI